MLLLWLFSYGGWKFSHLHREKVPDSCLCTPDMTNCRVSLPSRDSWDRFYSEISSCGITTEDESRPLKDLLHDMAAMPIKRYGIEATLQNPEFSRNTVVNSNGVHFV